MSEEANSALIGGLGGGLIGGMFAIVGVVVGLWLERWLRTRGNIHCVLGTWERSGLQHDSDGLSGVIYNASLRFFNEKEQNTGVHDLSLVFIDSEGKEAIIGPLADPPDKLTRVTHQRKIDLNDLIELPSQKWATTNIQGSLRDEDARVADRWVRVEVRGHFPNKAAFSCQLRSR